MRFLTVLFLLFPTICAAQGVATLIADNVSVETGNRLVAHGNVEVLFDGTRLIANSVIYDDDTNQLLINGPIVITTPDGNVLTATQAQLDPKLQNGVLRSARLVLDRQLQLAANQIDQIEGRYSQLYKTAVTSCQVCGDSPPLWEIRAERVVHDQQARQLYFSNATLRLRGFPIFWIPRARLPDPTLKRATGFLIPDIRTTDLLGTGIRTPYFIVNGDHRDITLTPYISPATATFDMRYRQAFTTGYLELNASISDDILIPENLRGRFFAFGEFDLGRDFILTFDIETTSDPAYLLDYGYSTKDRLDSMFQIARVRQNDLFVTNLTHYRTLREGESAASLPPLVADLRYERRDSLLGGVLTLEASADFISRYGNEPTENGRDVVRIGSNVGWQDQWVHRTGVVAQANLGAQVDYFQTSDDPLVTQNSARFVPYGSVLLRYPLQKTLSRASHVLEPVLAISWSDQFGSTPVNEDSTRPELDHGNLFSLSRFPADDAVETGLRSVIGINWSLSGFSGAKTNLTFGRVFNEVSNPSFNEGSGLNGFRSDWMLSGQIQLKEGLRIEGRALLDDELGPSMSIAKLDWSTDRLDLAASYLWQSEDTDIGASANSEWSFDASYQVTDVWNVSFDTRYDVIAEQPSHAALGIEWKNECVTANLSVSRRFTSSTSVDPSTDFGLSVELNGFSAGRSNSSSAAGCTN